MIGLIRFQLAVRTFQPTTPKGAPLDGTRRRSQCKAEAGDHGGEDVGDAVEAL